MNEEGISIVGVSCCCASDSDAHAEAHFETPDGRGLRLRMTRKAMEDCVSCFSMASLRANTTTSDQVTIMPATAEAVAPISGQVLMALAVGGIGTTLFLLSQADAIVLAAQLLDAATLSGNGGDKLQ